jgi:acetolactate decarboxylase
LRRNEEPSDAATRYHDFPGPWRALVDHAQRAHEPLAHIVSKALAEYLQIAHHTLYQVSTATALVEGIYQGAVRIGTLREHGDLGLGTFEPPVFMQPGDIFEVEIEGLSNPVQDG